MAEIDILLAAYNGEKFISEQIDSILNQTFQDFKIIIRDDGSSDKTPEIIEAYAQKFPGKIQVVHDDAICKKATKNFFQLLKYATANYVMFSDQDDYWLPYKVQITLDYMKKTERENPGLPVCVFTGLERVDANLKSLDEFMSLEVKKSDLVFQNVVKGYVASGCTEMFNREVYENLGEYSNEIDLHDWWITLYASACGTICHVPMALILYRIHADNCIGGKEKSLANRLWLIVKNPFRKFVQSRKFFYEMRDRLIFFRDRYSEKITRENLQYFNEVIKIYSNHKLTRLKALIKTKYLSQWGIIEKIINLVKILMF